MNISLFDCIIHSFISLACQTGVFDGWGGYRIINYSTPSYQAPFWFVRTGGIGAGEKEGGGG